METGQKKNYQTARLNFNFRKFKVALNFTYKILINFAKGCVLTCLSKVDNMTKKYGAVLNYKPIKL